jgi:hypothetical protein
MISLQRIMKIGTGIQEIKVSSQEILCVGTTDGWNL